MLFRENRLALSSPVKWVGGKSFLIQKVRDKVLANGDRDWFVEPFAGSLALTLHYQPKRVIVNDICFPLINMWRVIKENVDSLVWLLEQLSHPSHNNKERYNEIRDVFNALKNRESLSTEEKINLAAYFIYLNKRCFNGLYRENSSGKFNASYRLYKTNQIYNEENIGNLSRYFNESEVMFSSVSFELLKIPVNSFIYLDPPYYPCSTSSFTGYHKDGFSADKQIQLRDCCVKWDTENQHFLQSNAPCEEIETLYECFKKESFFIGRTMRSAIKGKEKETGQENNEILIWNF